MTLSLEHEFKKTSRPNMGGGGTILNYVWINKGPVDTKASNTLCGVPLHYLDKAVENAEKYPEATVNIWIDNALLDSSSEFFVSSYHFIFGTKNLKFCNFKNISEYKSDEIFKEDTDVSIWSRVNYARMLVVKHCFDTTDAKAIFYSDFDIEDTRIDTLRVMNTLNEFGVIIGASRHLLIENAYFGFTNKAQDLLVERFIPETRKAIDGDEDVSVSYKIYAAELDKWFVERGNAGYADDIAIRIMPDVGSTIPHNPAYSGLVY